jgi:hypothetical protein
MPKSRRAVGLVTLILSLIVPISLRAQNSRRWGDPSLVLEQFAVSSDGDELTSPVTFKCKTYRFIGDTGSELTVFDKTLRPDLGEVKDVALGDAATGGTSIELFDALGAFVGKLNLESVETVACPDLEVVGQRSGLDEYGIIGMDFLRRQVVQFDSDRGTLSLLKSAPPSCGYPVLITSMSGRPTSSALD